MNDVDTRHIVLQAAGECMAPNQCDLIERVAENDPDVYDRFLACIERRIAKPELLKALVDLLGPEDDPRIGWLGHAKTSPDHFRCEHCGAEDLDCTKQPHKADCLVVKARAAIAKATGASHVSQQ